MEASFNLIVEIVLVFAAVANAGIILPVFQKLTESERTNMASFKLNPEETLKDFKAFFAITAVFMVVISLFIFANILNNPFLATLGNVLSIISSFLPLFVFYRWWRRFK
jgi:hypothetical protein